MPAQRGLDLLLKLGDGGGPETFSTVAGLRATSLSFNAEIVDVTHAQSAGRWRELLDGGVRSASVSGAGVFLDDATAQSIRALFFSGGLRNWQVIIPGLGTIEGPFHLANLDYAGDHDREATVSVSLASAGELVFTAA